MAMDYLPRIRRNRVTLFIYYGMRVLVLLGSAIFFIQGDWASSAGAILVFLLMLAPSLLERQYRFYLPFSLDLGAVFFIFGTLFLGGMLRFYKLIPIWDKFTHFESGIILSVTGLILVYILNEHEPSVDLNPFFIALFAVTFSLALGVVWEMGEFVGDWLTGGHWQASNADTMWDLIADGGGALLMSTLSYLWMRERKRLPFAPRAILLLRRLAHRRRPRS